MLRTLKVNEDGNAIEWDKGAELSAIGIGARISRRQVASYRKDKPIPRHIALAARYLLEHGKKA